MAKTGYTPNKHTPPGPLAKLWLAELRAKYHGYTSRQGLRRALYRMACSELWATHGAESKRRRKVIARARAKREYSKLMGQTAFADTLPESPEIETRHPRHRGRIPEPA